MKFYWNCDTHGRPEKNQPLYCCVLGNEFMELTTNEEKKLDDEKVSIYISKYDNIMGKYETSDYIFYGYLDKNNNTFVEFLKAD